MTSLLFFQTRSPQTKSNVHEASPPPSESYGCCSNAWWWFHQAPPFWNPYAWNKRLHRWNVKGLWQHPELPSAHWRASIFCHLWQKPHSKKIQQMWHMLFRHISTTQNRKIIEESTSPNAETHCDDVKKPRTDFEKTRHTASRPKTKGVHPIDRAGPSSGLRHSQTDRFSVRLLYWKLLVGWW